MLRFALQILPVDSLKGFKTADDKESASKHKEERSGNTACLVIIHSFIHFPVVPNLEHRAPLEVSVITHTIRHTVGLLWTSDQPVAEASTNA
jgi:hypothetical protein